MTAPGRSEWNAARAANAARYREALADVGDLQFQARAPFSNHIYHLFVVETDRRDDLQKHLFAAGIQTVMHYPVPLHLQPAYSELGYRRGDFPNAERLASRVLSLPMYPELTEVQIERVSQSIKEFFRSTNR